MTNLLSAKSSGNKGTTAVFTINDVIKQGVCVGCGACAVVDDSILMRRNKFGSMEASLKPGSLEALSIADQVCPFSDNSLNEDNLAANFFRSCASFDSRTGYYNDIFYGRRSDDDALMHSSSGGLTSFVAIELLKKNFVDGIIHVGKDQSSQRDALFHFVTSYSEDDANQHKKSQYYSLSFDEVIKSIRGNGKRYVIVGVPCFIKSLKNVCLHDEVLGKQILFTLGLVCGHLKSSKFAELLSWQLNVTPEKIKTVDFRKKNKDSTVNAYDFKVVNSESKEFYKTSSSLLGGNWGHAAFQLQACDYCDDIFAETADAVFGDAWLPQFSSYWQGTNIVLVRNKVITEILQSAKQASRITLENLSVDDLCKSQEGNFRHRKDGLIVRLTDDLKAGKKIPKKRVNLNDIALISSKRKKIVRLRKKMAYKSHEYYLKASQHNNLDMYMNPMHKLARKMQALYFKDPFLIRIIRKFRSLLH